jgi:kanamycin kinase/aminoglycoside 3'-phosphotransferase-3
MHDLDKLPKKIANRLTGLSWNSDDVGKSASTILLFDDMVLKTEKISRSSENEIKLLNWLDGKLPVPKIIEAEIQDGYSFLLMSRLPGEMACSDNSLRNMEDTVRALANGLKMLWQIDISNCPCSNVVSEKMNQAKYRVENNLVNTDDFNPETFSSEGFKDIPDLYEYLDRNRPKEDFIFSHGDFCLPNVFVDGCGVTGFLDWGCGGIADRWQDIALCVRSLRHNYVECAGYGESEYNKYKNLLFQELAIEPNEEKIRYYILLDELF